MILSPPLLLSMIALLVSALFVSLLSTYRKTRILKKLTQVFEKYKGQALSGKTIEILETGIPKQVSRPLKALIETWKQDYERLSAVRDRLLASNRVFTHNMEGFERLLDVISDGILMVNLSGNIILVNQAMCGFLGTRRENIMGKPLKTCLDRPGWCDFPSDLHQDVSAAVRIKGSRMTQTFQASFRSIMKDRDQVGKIFFVRDVTDPVMLQ